VADLLLANAHVVSSIILLFFPMLGLVSSLIFARVSYAFFEARSQSRSLRFVIGLLISILAGAWLCAVTLSGTIVGLELDRFMFLIEQGGDSSGGRGWASFGYFMFSLIASVGVVLVVTPLFLYFFKYHIPRRISWLTLFVVIASAGFLLGVFLLSETEIRPQAETAHALWYESTRR